MAKRIRVRDRSTMSLGESIGSHLLWMFIIFLNYNRLIFITLNGYPAGRSRWILIGCMAAASVAGIFFRRNTSLTSPAVFSDILTGAGIYTMFSYRHYYRGWIRGILVISILMAILCTCSIFRGRYRGQKLSQIRDDQIKFAVVRCRMLRSVNASGLALGVMMTILLIPIGYNHIWNGGVITAHTSYTADSGYNNDYTESAYSLQNNLESIAKIRSWENWKPLSTREKLQVLQDICNCEANYWGMDFAVTVAMNDLGESTLGAYDDSAKTILIDQQHLEEDSPDSILKTCLHEMYHAWEHCLVRLYLESSESQRRLRIFRHCDEYISEMQDYQSAGNDYDSFFGYYYQYMEVDSREYAKTACELYYEEIDYLLGTMEDDV